VVRDVHLGPVLRPACHVRPGPARAATAATQTDPTKQQWFACADRPAHVPGVKAPLQTHYVHCFRQASFASNHQGTGPVTGPPRPTGSAVRATGSEQGVREPARVLGDRQLRPARVLYVIWFKRIWIAEHPSWRIVQRRRHPERRSPANTYTSPSTSAVLAPTLNAPKWSVWGTQTPNGPFWGIPPAW